MRLNRKLLLLILICSSVYLPAMAQQTDTTKPVSVDPELEAIMNSKVPREYVIAGITVSGSKTFDSALLVSITGIAVGDKVYLPGVDLFS
jgi:outer membrane protein insertion porin family